MLGRQQRFKIHCTQFDLIADRLAKPRLTRPFPRSRLSFRQSSNSVSRDIRASIDLGKQGIIRLTFPQTKTRQIT
jgi:hypothetical protein